MRMGKWEFENDYKYINLNNALEQYKATGIIHRTEIILRCSACNMRTCMDGSMEYKFCPHCGAQMAPYDLKNYKE